MKKHILIVDDEAEIREMLNELLTASGYRVTTTATAVEAKNLVEADKPDLIISDLQLENSDGLAMIEEIKATHPDIPAILLTGLLFDAKVVEERIKKKVSAYLPKTSPLKTILGEIRRLAGS